MSDGDRVHTNPGDTGASFPDTHAIPNRVRAPHGLAEHRKVYASRFAKTSSAYAISGRNKIELLN